MNKARSINTHMAESVGWSRLLDCNVPVMILSSTCRIWCAFLCLYTLDSLQHPHFTLTSHSQVSRENLYAAPCSALAFTFAFLAEVRDTRAKHNMKNVGKYLPETTEGSLLSNMTNHMGHFGEV